MSDFEVVKPATEDQCRAAFEQWFTSNGDWPAGVARSAKGEYLLMSAHSAWSAWRAGWAARTEPPR